MRFIRQKPRTILASLIVALALTVPAAASAWSWGYNYIGPGTVLVPGWNYWSYSSANKQSGGRIYQEWKSSEPGGSLCDNLIDGVTTYFSTPGDCHFGGYVRAEWGYVFGNSSYTYAETN